MTQQPAAAVGSARTVGATDVRETHVSWLFLLGDRAYKLKKPVKLDFLDLSSPAERERQCRREVELNRRLAPDVYLGVAEIRGVDGAVCDHLVVMQRMPEDRRLSTLVGSGAELAGPIREIARAVAAFHARADTSPTISASGSVDAVRGHWEDNFTTIAPFVGSVLDPEMATRVQTRARRYLDGRAPLFEQRITEGAVRDGHGDLLADDIFCLDDGPRILDCLEFDDDLRFGDVVADIGFLAMDLERIGAPALARGLLADYQEFAGETHPMSLAHHYIAYRAHVRAKVACLRAAQTTDPQPVQAAQHLLALADAHLDEGRVRLVLVGGLPGTGKSTVAAGISDRLGWTVLRTDEIRKDLAGLGHATHGDDEFGTGLYGAGSTKRTYETMLDRARRLLEAGESVVLDGSWTDRTWRDAARAVAEHAAADVMELRCELAAHIAARRIAARAASGEDASDADREVAARLASIADPWPSATPLDTAVTPTAALDAAVRACRLSPASGHPGSSAGTMRP